MAISFQPEDAARMEHIQKELVRLLLRYRENTEAALAVFALVRSAKTMLGFYPPATQKWLLEVITAFLNGGPAPPGADDESRILLM